MDLSDPELNEATKLKEIRSNAITLQLKKPMVESSKCKY